MALPTGGALKIGDRHRRRWGRVEDAGLLLKKELSRRLVAVVAEDHDHPARHSSHPVRWMAKRHFPKQWHLARERKSGAKWQWGGLGCWDEETGSFPGAGAVDGFSSLLVQESGRPRMGVGGACGVPLSLGLRKTNAGFGGFGRFGVWHISGSSSFVMCRLRCDAATTTGRRTVKSALATSSAVLALLTQDESDSLSKENQGPTSRGRSHEPIASHLTRTRWWPTM